MLKSTKTLNFKRLIIEKLLSHKNWRKLGIVLPVTWYNLYFILKNDCYWCGLTRIWFEIYIFFKITLFITKKSYIN